MGSITLVGVPIGNYLSQYFANLYLSEHDKLCTIENIEVADDNARKNKNKKYGINKHDKNRQYENEDLVDKLLNLKYKTSKYSLYKIYEPKERIIYRLPYSPDRIAHHAIMLNILELILLEMVKLIMLIVEIKFYFILYIDLIIFLLLLKLLNMIGVFILKVKKKKLNLKHNIL